MFEFIFVLVVAYGGYLIYKNSGHNAQSNAEKTDNAINLKSPDNEVVAADMTDTQATKTNTAEKSQSVKPMSEANKAVTPKTEFSVVMMKNPATGEKAKVTSNYRTTKRWIKEALIEEGLLDRIYKNNELNNNNDIKETVAKALAIIKAMDKYKV